MGLNENRKTKKAPDKRWIIIFGMLLLCMVFGVLIGVKKHNGNTLKDKFEEQIEKSSQEDNGKEGETEKNRTPIIEKDYVL